MPPPTTPTTSSARARTSGTSLGRSGSGPERSGSLSQLLKIGNRSPPGPPAVREATGPSEHGFWAELNPAVAHPRPLQMPGRLLLGDDERVPTRIFNGYPEQVAGLYNHRPTEKSFM
jgi:hypothetical protein